MILNPCDGECLAEVRANTTLRIVRDRLYSEIDYAYDWVKREMRWQLEVERTLREAMRWATRSSKN